MLSKQGILCSAQSVDPWSCVHIYYFALLWAGVAKLHPLGAGAHSFNNSCLFWMSRSCYNSFLDEGLYTGQHEMHSSYNLQSVRSMKYVQSVERQSLLETYVSVQSLLPVSPLKEVVFLKKNLSGNRMVLAFLVQNPLFPFACTCAIACAHTCTAYPPTHTSYIYSCWSHYYC